MQQPSLSTSSVTLYVDGACRGNPGKGGWGVYIQYPDGQEAEFCGGEAHTTNNRMELMAAIEGLVHTDPAIAITVWTDSNYVQKGISEWIHSWKKKNWKKSDGGAVVNVDLWQRLDQLSQKRQIEWRWIKGHAGHAGNEKADQLANQGLETQGKSVATSSHKGSNIAAEIKSSTVKAATITECAVKPTALMDLLLPPEDEDQSFDEPDWFIEEEHAAFDAESATHDEQELLEAYPVEDLIREDKIVNSTSLYPPADLLAEQVSSNQSSVENINKDSVSKHGIIRTQNTTRLDAFTSNGKRQLILDTETTGFDPKTGDRIVEIGVIELINRKLTGNSLHVYLNPQRPVGSSEEIHGLSDAFLSDKPLFAEIVEELETFLAGAEVIAHNASFDMRFLEAELQMAGRMPLAERVSVTDTLAIAKRKHPGQKNSLDALAKRYQVKERDRTFHGALLDAEILADVYLQLTGGQVTLDMDSQEDQNANAIEARDQVKRKLAVIHAHADELALHQAWLKQMDGGKDGPVSLWHKMEQAEQVANESSEHP